VLAELRRRDPEKYDSVQRIGFTPGPNWDGSVEQIADAMQAVDREMANPYRRMASRLGGEAFFLRDNALQRFDYSEGHPGKPIPLTPDQKAAGRLAELINEACDLLREAASAIEAATAGETVQHGSTEGESATAKPGRPNTIADTPQ
jgi:hypothetical protein